MNGRSTLTDISLTNLKSFKILYMFMQGFLPNTFIKYQWTPIFWEQAYHMTDRQFY